MSLLTIIKLSGSVYNQGSLMEYLSSNSSVVALDEDTIQFTFEKQSPFIYDILMLNIIESDLFDELCTSCVNGNIESCSSDINKF